RVLHVLDLPRVQAVVRRVDVRDDARHGPPADGHHDAHPWLELQALGRPVGEQTEPGDGHGHAHQRHQASSRSSAMTFFRSSQASRFLSGLRSRYAGWKVGTNFAARSGNTWPRSREMGVSVRSSARAADEPSPTTTFGWMMSIWRSRNGSQAATSSGSGVRFAGGRHLTTLAMYTLSRV